MIQQKKEQASKSKQQQTVEKDEGLLQGQCYCGSIKFEVKTSTAPYKSLYCHCQSCRRAHSAPIYQICYIPNECFSIKNGLQLVTQFARPKQGSPIRAFCKICGSRIYNKLPAQPQLGTGVFPALFKEKSQHNLPEQFRPKYHHLSNQSVVDLSKIKDGLPRV